MNRAMFSGVAGLKAHQTKMDVIGNNIANVNTYGFKSQRAVFSDIYYQTIKSASGGTTSRGGTNPSSVGYGSTLAAIQTQMTQSSMQNTGFGLDVAITGEGFFQVMDADGNIFYTKAGLLDYDSNGYLTDINGNFVLGATSVDGAPGVQKIRLDNIGSVDPTKPSATETIQGIDYTVTASNATKYGNVSLNIGASEQLPAGLKASATISVNGTITVLLNAYEKFSSMSELNNAVNAAIREANGGKEHAAGTFTITASKDVFSSNATNGTWTGAAQSQGTKLEPADADGLFGGAFTIDGLDLLSLPAAAGATDMTLTKNAADYSLSVVIGGVTYAGTFTDAISAGTSVTLKDTTTVPDSGKSITLSVADKAKLADQLAMLANPGDTANSGVQQTPPQYFFGGAQLTGVSADFAGQGAVAFSYTLDPVSNLYTVTATVGGKAYTGQVSSLNGGSVTLQTGDPADGTMTLSVPSKTQMLQNYGISATDPNADTLLSTALTNSLGLHNYTAVPATSGQGSSLTGAQIAGVNFGVQSGAITGLEDGAFGGAMTFMKTSSDFAGSGVVNGNDFKATYADDGDAPYWKIGMTINGVEYSADIAKDTLSSSLLLKSPGGDYIQVSNPGFDAMNAYYKQLNPGVDPTDGDELSALTGGATLAVTPATPSKDLGFSSTSFTLTGGTEGGPITLDQLSSIAIGADGTVSVSHPEKGTVVAGKISLATFANPSGLQLQGSNYYSATANSGDPVLCDPGSGGTGALKSSALEMSNVDLSAEFADMITTQRGFQANSRIITVSDTMLEELINLKR